MQGRARFFHHSPALTAAVLLAVLFTLGCGSDERTPPESGAMPGAEATPTAPVEIPSTLAPETEPEAEVSQGELPSTYPTDLPTYPGAVPDASLAVPDGAMLVTFRSDAAAEDILEYFRNELPSSGWTVSEAGESLEAAKGGRSVSIRAEAGEDGDSVISVAITSS